MVLAGGAVRSPAARCGAPAFLVQDDLALLARLRTGEAAAFETLDRYDRRSLSTWVFRILVNRARTRATRDARSAPFSALEPDEHGAIDPQAFGTDGRWPSAPSRLDTDPEARRLSEEMRGQVIAVIETLVPAQRAVITLRDLVGLGAEDVCSLLEIGDGNQRVLLQPRPGRTCRQRSRCWRGCVMRR